MSKSVLGLDVSSYERHRLHGPDTHWPETNCSLDMWIELLHSLSLEPVAAGAFTLAGDFVDDQWRFLKFPVEDLWELYGISVNEINVWRSIHDQITELLSHGRLVTVEVDAFYLPDLVGTSYHEFHTKTSIVIDRLDVEAREIDYFHAAGYHRLAGSDYDAVLPWTQFSTIMAPYAEVIELDRLTRVDLRPIALAQLARHLSRRPATNPVARMCARIEADLPWVQGELGLDGYHLYAFGGLRQCGAGAQLATAFLRWLSDDFHDAAGYFEQVAVLTKSAQFLLARAARGRTVEVSGQFGELAAAWDAGISSLVQKL